jgi:hypothetical protein
VASVVLGHGIVTFWARVRSSPRVPSPVELCLGLLDCHGGLDQRRLQSDVCEVLGDTSASGGHREKKMLGLRIQGVSAKQAIPFCL